MEFRVLGPVEVRDEGRSLRVGGAKQRALLAVLLLDAGRVVSSDRLIEDLWGEDPPATAPKMLQMLVSRLRSVLENGGSERVLITQSPGYAVRIDDQQLDLSRFGALVAAGRAALPGDPPTAAAQLRDALALWKGEPLADVALEPFAGPAIARLEELRLSAIEDRVDADLALGRQGDLIGELRDLVARNPLRERLRRQLMLALYRSGRQAEALDAYREARSTLVDTLGIEPGPELRQLEGAILQQDPALDLGMPASSVRPEAPIAFEQTQSVAPAEAGASTAVPPTRRRRRRIALLMAALALTILVLALALSAGGKSGTGLQAKPNSIAVIDPSSGALVGDVAVGTQPGPMAVTGGSVWVGNLIDNTVMRIAIPSQRVTKTFGLATSPESLAGADGLVWVVDGFTGMLTRIIAAYNQQSSPFYPGPALPGQLAVATSPGTLWVGLADGRLLRLNAASLHLDDTSQAPQRAFGMVVQDDKSWSTPFEGNDVTWVVPGASPQTGSIPLPGHPVAVSAGDGSIWVATAPDDRLWQLSPATGAILGSTPIGVASSGIAVTPDAVWVAGGSAATLERIDPKHGTLVETIRLGHPIGGIAVAGDDLWLTLD